ncbi:MAG: pyridoxamine 5'-phosphate oxidase family protein [Alphaproteobacteria bacterium]
MPDQTDQLAQQGDLQTLARTILDSTALGSLSTLAAAPVGDAGAGAPYTSLVLIGQDPADGAPVLLLSGLARHTQNLKKDPRGSLLLAPPTAQGEGPLEGARLTVMGRFCEIGPESGESDAKLVRQAYLDRHPDAATYVDFGDFSLWRLAIAGAHLVAGFGRITEIPVNSLIFKRF